LTKKIKKCIDCKGQILSDDEYKINIKTSKFLCAKCYKDKKYITDEDWKMATQKSIKTIKIKLNISNKKKKLLTNMMYESQKCANYLQQSLINDMMPKIENITSETHIKDEALKTKINNQRYKESIAKRVNGVYKRVLTNYKKTSFKPQLTVTTRLIKIQKNPRSNYMLRMSNPYEPHKTIILPITGQRYNTELEYLLKNRHNEFPCNIIKTNKREFYACIGVKTNIPKLKIDNTYTPVAIDRGMTNLVTLTALETLSTKGIKPSHIKFLNGGLYKHKNTLFDKRLRILQKGKKRKRTLIQQDQQNWNKYYLQNVAKEFGDHIIKNIYKPVLGVENLSNIYKMQQNTHNKRSPNLNWVLSIWPYARLQQYIEQYLSKRGVPTIYLDPKGTSRTCPICGEKNNIIRDIKKHMFICKTCDYTLNDDMIGAYNIAIRLWERINNKKWVYKKPVNKNKENI